MTETSGDGSGGCVLKRSLLSPSQKDYVMRNVRKFCTPAYFLVIPQMESATLGTTSAKGGSHGVNHGGEERTGGAMLPDDDQDR